MVETITMYEVVCDRCGEQMANRSGITAWMSKDGAVAEMNSLGWKRNQDGQILCKSCAGACADCDYQEGMLCDYCIHQTPYGSNSPL